MKRHALGLLLALLPVAAAAQVYNPPNALVPGGALFTLGSTAITYGGTTTAVAGLTLSGGAVSTGALTSTGGSAPSLANGTAYLLGSATGGLVIGGQGSSTDFSIRNKNNAAILSVGTGGTALFANSLNLSAVPFLGSAGTGGMGGSTTLGGVYAGNGSTNDVTIENKSAAAVMSVPTGTTTASFAGAITAAGLSTSSAATTGTLCWTTGTGNINVDTTTTCLASSMRFKHDWKPIAPTAALSEVMRYKPGTFLYNDDLKIPGVQAGFTAEDMAAIDPDLVVYEDGRPLKVKTLGIIAKLVAAMQEQQAEIAELKRGR